MAAVGSDQYCRDEGSVDLSQDFSHSPASSGLSSYMSTSTTTSSSSALALEAMETVPFPSNAKIVQVGDIIAKLVPNRGVGLLATSDIPADTPILIERPILSWTRGAYNARKLASRLIRMKDFRGLTSTLFPKTLNDLPEARKQQYSEPYLTSILEMAGQGSAGSAASLGTSPPPPSSVSSFSLRKSVSEEQDAPTIWDALRIHFCLDCNSFPSGVMLALSYCNHSCDPNSRVTEYPDEEGEGDACDDDAMEVKVVYHLTTVRDIRRGEEITISYVDFIASLDLAEDRRRYLEEHYLFACDCVMCEYPLNEGFCCIASTNPKEQAQDSTPSTSATKERSTAVNTPTTPIIAQNPPPPTTTPTDPIRCPGEINPRSGRCGTCHHEITPKELDKLTARADKVILKARRLVVEGNEVLEAMDVDAAADEMAQISIGTSSLVGGRAKGLGDRVAEIEEVRKKGVGILHPNHIAFMAMDACVDKLRVAIKEDGGRVGGDSRDASGLTPRGKGRVKDKKKKRISFVTPN
ncbi:SET and MYND domain-containing protein 5 [Dinochytrium kinnereticum]|nr:SET and MYND domain-containing protein 5 [Dinochytrium kinnereticum]